MENDIKCCRLCLGTGLTELIDLGHQALTGVFPASREASVQSYRLTLVKCDSCDLVQLKNNPPLNLMFSENYGYRSGLNQSMVQHLKRSVNKILDTVVIEKNDLIVDIGSNDGTLLGFYPEDMNLNIVGVDPIGKHFLQYYKKHISLISDFFPSNQLNVKFPNQKAKIITSFSCFYDLERPMDFAKAIKEHLDENGVWIFEQSYLPLMIERLSYDTICHEHLEYYCLKQLKYILDRVDMKIIEVDFNDVNGGSICLFAAHKNSKYKEATEKVQSILNNEDRLGCSALEYFKRFSDGVTANRSALRELLSSLQKSNKKVVGLGASTKGNVVLQYCQIDERLVSKIGEVNELKYGKFTPGTKIPIVSEAEISEMNPHYKLILPWHFKETFLAREKEYMARGGRLIFPLPQVEIYPQGE